MTSSVEKADGLAEVCYFVTSMALVGAGGAAINYYTPAALIRLFAIVRTGGRYAGAGARVSGARRDADLFTRAGFAVAAAVWWQRRAAAELDVAPGHVQSAAAAARGDTMRSLVSDGLRAAPSSRCMASKRPAPGGRPPSQPSDAARSARWIDFRRWVLPVYSSLPSWPARTATQLYQVLAVAMSGRSVLLITHRLSGLAMLVDEVALMQRGRIVECVPVATCLRWRAGEPAAATKE